jgi:DNA (cytosine-5)-methyltransferase 1
MPVMTDSGSAAGSSSAVDIAVVAGIVDSIVDSAVASIAAGESSPETVTTAVKGGEAASSLLPLPHLPLPLPNRPPFTFIEVCAGAGGLSHGFTSVGFVPVLLNDVDKHCVNTLRHNYPEVEVFAGSMTDIDLQKYVGRDSSIDVLMGGVPCQSFSQAGKQKGIADDRGQLILEFVRMVDVIEPKVFLIENVKGLLHHNKGATFQLIRDEYAKLGKYTISHQVLNANDYGVPQKRERLIMVGVRNDIPTPFAFPTPHAHKPVLKEVLTDCPASPGSSYSEKKIALFDQIPQGGCWVDLPLDVQKAYLGKSFFSGGGKRGILKRLAMDKPSLTLLTTPSQKQTERCHPLETRPLQILEYARIQTFADEYHFTGTLNQQYKQIGNAVPVLLAKAIAEQVALVLQ